MTALAPIAKNIKIKLLLLSLSFLFFSCQKKKENPVAELPAPPDPAKKERALQATKTSDSFCWEKGILETYGIQMNQISEQQFAFHKTKVYESNTLDSIQYEAHLTCQKIARIRKIKVFHQGQFQELVPREYYLPDLRKLEAPHLDILDLNFDGFQDFRLFSSRSGAANLIYSYYLYLPDKKEFAFHEELSNTGNLKIKADEKKLETYWHISAGEYIRNYYQLNGTRLKHLGGEQKEFDGQSKQVKISKIPPKN